MLKDGSTLEPENIATKIAAVRSLAYPELTRQFEEQPRLVEVLWFLEWRRRQPRGIDGFAEELVRFAGNGLMPAEFLALPVDKHGRFSAQDVFAVWSKLPANARPTAGDEELAVIVQAVKANEVDGLDSATESGLSHHQVDAFRAWLTRECCMQQCVRYAGERLNQVLVDFLFDPAKRFPSSVAPPPSWSSRRTETCRLLANLPGLILGFMDAQAQRTENSIAQTRVTKMIFEAVRYALRFDVLVTITGDSRFGKTDSLQTYCDAHPGLARRVRTPANGGLKDLLLAIADALGLRVDCGSGTAKLKERIQHVLKNGGPALLFDESQFLVPASFTSTTPPARLNFVRTEIVDAQLPCVLAATPQAHKQTIEAYQRKTKYALEQWLGRVDMHYECPTEFCKEDLISVARVRLPGIPDKALRLIVARAMQSEQFLHALTAIARRAQWIAEQTGRTEPAPADIDMASEQFINGVQAPDDTRASDAVKAPAPAPPLAPPAACGRRQIRPAAILSSSRNHPVPEMAALLGPDHS